jgi:ribosome recycling factor
VRNLRRDANEHLKKLLKDKDGHRGRRAPRAGRCAEAHRPHVAEIDKLVQAKEAEIMAV